MKFVRYKGGVSEGEFTAGTIYKATDELEADARSHERFIVRDDKGKRFKFRYDDGYFVELPCIYAVWVCDSGSFEQGEALLIEDGEDEHFEVAGYGFFNSNCFEVLDGDNLHPHMHVCDPETGRWVEVMRVDEQFGLSTEEDPDRFRTPNDYVFAVSGGSVVDVPLLYCTDATGANLTPERAYTPVMTDGDKVVVVDDNGVETEFPLSRFGSRKAV